MNPPRPHLPQQTHNNFSSPNATFNSSLSSLSDTQSQSSVIPALDHQLTHQQPPQKWNAALHLFRHLTLQLHVPAIDKEFYYHKFMHMRSSANWYALLHLIEALEEHKRRTCLVMKAVRERERVMLKLRSLAQKYDKRQKSALYVQNQGMRLLQKLQMTSLKVVELVIFWRQTLTRPWAYRMNLRVKTSASGTTRAQEAAKTTSAANAINASSNRTKKSSSAANTPTTNTIFTTNYLLHMLDDAKWLDKSCLSFILPVKLTNTPLLSAFATLGQIKLSKRQRGASTPSSLGHNPLTVASAKNTTAPQLDANSLQLTRRLLKAERIIQEESNIQRNLKKHLQQLLFNGYFVPVLNTPQIVEECYSGVEIDQNFRPEYHEMLTQFRENIVKKQAVQKDTNLLISPKQQQNASSDNVETGDKLEESAPLPGAPLTPGFSENLDSGVEETEEEKADLENADDDDDFMDLDDENVPEFDEENFDGQGNDEDLYDDYNAKMPREYDLEEDDDEFVKALEEDQGDNQVLADLESDITNADEEGNTPTYEMVPDNQQSNIIEQTSKGEANPSNNSVEKEEDPKMDISESEGTSHSRADQSTTSQGDSSNNEDSARENVDDLKKDQREEDIEEANNNPPAEMETAISNNATPQQETAHAAETNLTLPDTDHSEILPQTPSVLPEFGQSGSNVTPEVILHGTQQTGISPGQIIETTTPHDTTNLSDEVLVANSVMGTETIAIENELQEHLLPVEEEDDRMSSKSDKGEDLSTTEATIPGEKQMSHLTIDLPTSPEAPQTSTPTSAALRRKSAEIHIPSGSPVTPLSANQRLDDDEDLGYDLMDRTPRADEF